MTRPRLSPSAIDVLPARLAFAANTYATAYESVAAGGAVIPSGNAFSCEERGGSGSPSKEGRQSNAVDQVAFLRRLDAAVGPAAVIVAPRAKLAVAHLDLWRAVAIEGMSLRAFVAARGLGHNARRFHVLKESLIASAERVADAIGGGRSPFDWLDPATFCLTDRNR